MIDPSGKVGHYPHIHKPRPEQSAREARFAFQPSAALDEHPMTLTLADRIAREVESLARDVMAIPVLSRHNPDATANAKIDAARKAERIACDLRNTFGGQPQQFRPGPAVHTRAGRPVAVQIRRRAA